MPKYNITPLSSCVLVHRNYHGPNALSVHNAVLLVVNKVVKSDVLGEVVVEHHDHLHPGIQVTIHVALVDHEVPGDLLLDGNVLLVDLGVLHDDGSPDTLQVSAASAGVRSGGGGRGRPT